MQEHAFAVVMKVLQCERTEALGRRGPRCTWPVLECSGALWYTAAFSGR